MQETNVKNIVFDLGGVLIDWNPRYVYRTIFDSEEEVDSFLTDVCTMKWNVQQDAGRSLEDATEWLINEKPEWTQEIKAYYGRWEEMLGGPIQGTVEILIRLKAQEGYRILALTNWSSETFPVAQERYEFLKWFEGIVVSGEEKCIKPDPEIYQILLRRYDLVAEETLFIDDNSDNIAGAELLGIQGIKFVDAEALASAMEERSLLS